MILNPWFWLGALLIVLAAGATGYFKGHRDAQNAAQAAHAVALEATIKESRENAVIDMQAAVEAETSRQATRVEFKDRIVTVERLVNATSIPAECKLSDATVGVFNDAINAVNSKANAKHEPVPAAPPAPNRKPTGTSASLDNRH